MADRSKSMGVDDMEKEPCEYRHVYNGGYVCWLASDSLTKPCEYEGVCERARKIKEGSEGK